MQETQDTWVQSLGGEDPLEQETATHSSILTWEIPWTEESGRLQSMGLQRVIHEGAQNFSWAFDPSRPMYLFVLWHQGCAWIWSSARFLQAGSASRCSWDAQSRFKISMPWCLFFSFNHCVPTHGHCLLHPHPHAQCDDLRGHSRQWQAEEWWGSPITQTSGLQRAVKLLPRPGTHCSWGVQRWHPLAWMSSDLAS